MAVERLATVRQFNELQRNIYYADILQRLRAPFCRAMYCTSDDLFVKAHTIYKYKFCTIYYRIFYISITVTRL